MKGKPNKAYLWRWAVVISLSLFLLTLYKYFIIPIFENKNAQKRLEYEVKPSVSLRFELGKGLDCQSSYFLLKNQGPGRLEHIWFVENVFLVEKDSVHECPDLPHFEYYHFKGSLRSMGVLEAGEEKQINLTPCWRKAMGLFFQKFSGKLVSRFTLSGNSLASPDYRAEFYFVIDPIHCDYIPATTYIGGKKLIDAVNKYVTSGPRSIIRWVCIDGPCLGFYKNPPKWWYKSIDSVYVPWYRNDLPPGEAVIWYPFSPYMFIPNKNSYAKFTWDCDSVISPAAVLMGSTASW